MIDALQIDRVARHQHGVVTRSQLVALGVAERTVGAWLDQGRLVRAQPGAFRASGAPDTWEGRLLAAVLAAGDGALASHRSAARLWGLYDGDELDLTVPRGRLPRLRGVSVHRPLDFPAQRSLRSEIPVTNPLRTLVDLGAVVAQKVVADAFDQARINRLVTFDGVERAWQALARPGRSGTGVLKRVLDAHALAMEAPDSRLEIRMSALIAAEALPPACFQYPVTCLGKDYRIDFAYPNRLLAIEVDGFAKRATPEAMAYDLDRQNDLIESGWMVVRFMWTDIVIKPKRVASRLARVLGTEPCAQDAESVPRRGRRTP